MQTRALMTLVEIARVGAFATAANNLNMTLSAVSMQMKSLERELDAPLFDRAFRPPRLTPLGRAICERAAGVLAAEDALRAVCRTENRLIGEFRLGFVMTACVRLLPEFLIAARNRAPKASFAITSGLSEALEEQVQAGRLDAAVVTASPAPRPGLRYDVLREEPLVYAVPRERPAAADPARPELLLATLPFLHFMPSSGIGKLIADYIAAIGPKAPGSTVLDSIEAIMECVKKGLGFTLLPQPDIARYADGRIAVVAPPAPGCARQLALVSPAARKIGWRPELIAALFAAD